MEHQNYRGKIIYRGDSVGERGREWFSVTRHRNGDRTLRAMCEIDDTQVLRDVVYTANAAWQPLDAFVRLTVRDEFMGSGWFRFSERLAECETWMAEGGRVSQRFELERRVPFFGVHPVAADCWCLGGFDLSKPQKIQTLQGGMMSSPLPNGASGPILSRFDLTIEYLGEEEVSVPAGTFPTRHFRFLLHDTPAEDLWCYGDDLIFVKIRWDLLKTTYELVELEL
jgi:hypothetical protein